MPEQPQGRVTGWFGVAWGTQRPLVTGNVGRHHTYPGSSSWRHALAWGRVRTDDIRMQFGGGNHVQLGPYEGSLLPRPDHVTLGAVDDAAAAITELLDEVDRLYRQLDERPNQPEPVMPGGIPWARLASDDIPDQRRSLQVFAAEPDRIAGVWGVALGRFMTGHREGDCVLMRDHRGDGHTSVRFSHKDDSTPSARSTADLTVDDLAEVLRDLQAVGAVIRDQGNGRAVVLDPENNTLVLSEHARS